MRSLPRLSLDGAVAGTIALTVLGFAAGSSSIDGVYDAGQRLRWAALGVLLALALVAAARVRPVAAPSAYAPAAALVVLALVSAAWSVDARLTFGRAVTLAALFATAGALGVAAAARPALGVAMLAGVAAGALAVLVVSLGVLAFDYSNAVQRATESTHARFQGFTANPNTIALLAAVSLPVPAAVAARPRIPRAARAAAAVTALGLVAAIGGSDSRGGFVAALAGLLVLAAAVPVAWRLRAVGAAVTVAVLAVAFGLAQIPDPGPRFSGIGHRTHPVPDSYVEAYPPLGCVELAYEDIGQPPCGQTFGAAPARGGSGRLAAWEHALDQAARRPAVGFGFGTEGLAFVDRFALFEGFLAENSYIGMLLQLGVAGLLALLAVAGSVALGVRRLGRVAVDDRWTAAAWLGVAGAGAVMGLYQSWFYSVGNIGAAVFWIAVFAFLALAFRTERAAA